MPWKTLSEGKVVKGPATTLFNKMKRTKGGRWTTPVIGTSFCDVPSNCDVTSYVTSFSPKFDVYGDFYVLLKKS